MDEPPRAHHPAHADPEWQQLWSELGRDRTHYASRQAWRARMRELVERMDKIEERYELEAARG